VTATFFLDMRGTFACPAPSTVDTAVLTIEDGKIVRREQLPELARRKGRPLTRPAGPASYSQPGL
jgi:hypothetical protein